MQNITKLVVGVMLLAFMYTLALTQSSEPVAAPLKQEVVQEVVQKNVSGEVLDRVRLRNDTAEAERHIRVLQHGLSEDRIKWYAKYTAHAAWMYDIDVDLMVVLIATESSFNPNEVSHAGAIGSTQVIPKWHPDNPHDVYDPIGNIYSGAYVLRKNYEECNKRWSCAFKSYNIGLPSYQKGDFQDAATRYYNKVQRKLSVLT